MNKKVRQISRLLCIIFVFCIVLSIIHVNSIAVYAKTDAPDTPRYSVSNFSNAYGSEEGKQYILFGTEKIRYLPDENILVTYSITTEESIVDVIPSADGFEIVSINISGENNSIASIELSCLTDSSKCIFTMQFCLESGYSPTTSLYAVNTDQGTFISQFSIDDARERYFDYALDQGIMTKEECDATRVEFYREHIIVNTNIETLTIVNSDKITATIDTSSQETYIEGLLQWEDDNFNTHPLRSVMVEIYAKKTTSAIFLGTIYTDNTGRFSFVIDVPNLENNGYDLFARIYAGDGNVMVTIGDSGTVYSLEHNLTENIPIASTIPCELTVEMSSDFGRAMQISQAIMTARDYARAMMGVTPEDITVRYPYDDPDPEKPRCYYEGSNHRITITGWSIGAQYPQSYASWDTLMHEYGHHIQHIVGNSKNPGFEHDSSQNNADRYQNKDTGIRLAWGESWPTVFGMMAQQYYSAYLTNIDTVTDTSYKSYNGLDYNIETNTIALGEACERSIMSVLWDLYDSNNEDNDVISLGHTAFWAITAINECYTFSDFISNFYNEYPSYIDDIGLNLTYYGMASSQPSIINSSVVSSSQPPRFFWTPHGGSTQFPNNTFSLIFYNSLGEEILRIATATSHLYTLTQDQWNSVLYSYGTTYTVTVEATQTASPETGPYISAKSSFTKPAPALSQTLNISANNRYTEDTVNLIPGQYIEYTITFSSSGNKLFQTFGLNDTIIYLYDQNHTLLAQNDDSGYTQNGFLNYTVNANTVYILRVKFYSSARFGEIRTAITPASIAYSRFEDIWNKNGSSGILSFSTSLNTTRILTFTPTESGTYKFTTYSNGSTTTDACLYLIDPTNVEGYLFDDDSAGNYQATISADLMTGRTYFIIVATYDITTTSGSLSLNISKIS